MRFILIHGGFHGAWCWDRVVPELEKLGHQAIALDLPGHGERAAERPANYLGRIQPILDVLQEGDVLVGHSGGGYDISVAANQAPDKVGHMIFLAAGLPIEGQSVIEATGGAMEDDGVGGEQVAELMDDSTGMTQFIKLLPDGSMDWTSKEGARTFFYHDCDDATVDWAFSKLTPGISPFPQEKLYLQAFWNAQLPRSYVLCRDDRSKPMSMSEEVLRRLGVEPLVIDASHSPFLSRPAELAALFVKAVGTEPVGPLLPE
ncbi:MAG: alpha/beta fold hydrolase [Novosphingobium sp.]|nr:alpha/beta fold hydrolase [Novosphingobium sp.]